MLLYILQTGLAGQPYISTDTHMQISNPYVHKTEKVNHIQENNTYIVLLFTSVNNTLITIPVCQTQ